MARTKDAELRIKATDHFSATLNKGRAKLDEFKKTASRKDLLNAALAEKQAIRDLTSEVSKLHDRYQSLRKAAPSPQVGVEMVKTRAAILEAKEAVDRKRAALQQLRGVAQGTFADFSRRASEAAAASAHLAANEQKAARIAELRAASQARLNNSVKSGFADWSRYADAINRVRTADDKAAAVAARKAAIQDRLNNSVKSGFSAWSRQVDLQNSVARATNTATAAALKKAAADQKAGAAASKRAKDQLGLNAALLHERPGGGMLASRGGRGKMFGGADADVEMYGLRPYQMVNLGYQVNDVVSGLAMGQAPLQILAQQAGQLAQIWPQVMVGIVRSLPQLAALGAVFTPIIINLVRARSEAQALASMGDRLAIFADRANYSAEALAKIAGNSAEAQERVMQLVRRGFNQDMIQPFLDVAGQMSAISGEKIDASFEKLAAAFDGGYESLREFDKQLGVFTASELQAIYAMYQAGDAAEAQNEAFRILRDRVKASEKEMGPWGLAMRDAGEAGASLLSLFKDSWLETIFVQTVRILASDLQRLASGANHVLELINRLSGGGTASSGGGIWNQSFENDTRALEAFEARLAVVQKEMDALREGEKTPGKATTLAVMQAEAEALEARVGELRRKTQGLLRPGDEGYGKALVDAQAHVDGVIAAIQQETAVVGLSNREKEKRAAYAALVAQNLGIETEAVDELFVAIGREIDAKHDAIDANEDADESAKALAKAEADVTSFISQQSTERERANEVIEKMESAIADLTQAHGAHNPVVLAASAALSRFKAEANAAEAEARSLAMAAHDLNRALASLGSFNADIDTRIASARRTLSMIEQGYSEARIRATEEVTRAMQKEIDMMIQQGHSIEDVARRQQELIDKQTLANELDEQVSRRMQERFNPKKGGGGRNNDDPRKKREEELNHLLEYRTVLLERIKFYEDSGQESVAAQLKVELEATNVEILQAIDGMIAFLSTMDGPEIQAAILNLQKLRDEMRKGNSDAEKAIESWDKWGAGSLTSSFGAAAEAIANGENAIESLADAFRRFAAEFLIKIGQMIFEQAALNALQSVGFGGKVTGFLGRFGVGVGAAVAHSGGIIGSGGLASRTVNPAVFAGATRYHGGGVAGLKPNEVPAILERGEEVLTGDDPRHAKNGGMTAKIVNVFDPVDVMEASLNTPRGEKVFFNWMTRNARAINGALSS